MKGLRTPFFITASLVYLAVTTISAIVIFDPTTGEDVEQCPKYEPYKRLDGKALTKCVKKFHNKLRANGVTKILNLRIKASNRILYMEYKNKYGATTNITVPLDCISYMEIPGVMVKGKIEIRQ